MVYLLVDKKGNIVSRHRSVAATAEAAHQLARDVYYSVGIINYPTIIYREDFEPVTKDERDEWNELISFNRSEDEEDYGPRF